MVPRATRRSFPCPPPTHHQALGPTREALIPLAFRVTRPYLECTCVHQVRCTHALRWILFCNTSTAMAPRAAYMRLSVASGFKTARGLLSTSPALPSHRRRPSSLPGVMLAVGGVSAKEQLDNLAAEIDELDRQIKRARKRGRRHVDPTGDVTPYRKRVASTLCYLAGSGTHAAALYIAGPRARRTQAGRNAAVGAWRGRIEEWYLEGDVADIVALGSPSTPWEHRVLRAARVFKVEHDLHAWVARRNEERGVAPTTASLRAEALAEWLRHQELVDVDEDAPYALRSAQPFVVWACRWRKRWGGRLGALRPREHVPVPLRRQKAPPHPRARTLPQRGVSASLWLERGLGLFM